MLGALLHGSILLLLMCRGANPAVWPWNAALAAAALVLPCGIRGGVVAWWQDSGAARLGAPLVLVLALGYHAGCVDHQDSYVFQPIARVLARALRPAVAARPHFGALLAAAPARAEMRKALADEAALAAWIRASGQSLDPGVRAAAAVLLPLLEADMAANLALLHELASDPEPMVRAAAAMAESARGR